MTEQFVCLLGGPSELDRMLFTNNRHVLGSFWDDYSSQTYAATHPIQDLLHEKHSIVPINWHVDAVRVFRGSGAHVNYVVWSWSSGIARGKTKDVKHVLTWCEKSRMIVPDTNEHVVRFIAWCQQQLGSGLMPMRGYNEEVMALGGDPVCSTAPWFVWLLQNR